jgi:Flp pilus assembly protein TadG
MAEQNTFRVRFSRRQRGAALVEYAFVFIVLFSFIFGITGFGHALYVYHAINNAAKEGTRWAAVNGKTCSDDNTCNGTNGMNSGPALTSDIVAHVSANLPASVETGNATISANFLAPAGSPPVCTTQVKDETTGNLIGPYNNYQGCTVQVTVSYAYNFSFPLLPSVTTKTSPCTQVGYCLSSTSEMVIAH